jgi:F0F1-type ATP synthase membrane subunit b/b'
MLAFFSVELLIIITAIGLTIAMAALLLLQMRSSSQMRKLTYPAYEYVVRKAEHDADAIIEEAQKKARSIIAEAEKTGQATMQSYEKSAKEANDHFVERFGNITDNLASHLEVASSKGTASVESFAQEALHALKAQQESVTGGFQEALLGVTSFSKELRTQTDKALAHMHKGVEDSQAALAQKLQAESDAQSAHISAFLEKTLASAEAEISAYQKSRIALLDTHIERLVEDVAKTVLHKELTLHDHAELARTALQEAKEHNVL